MKHLRFLFAAVSAVLVLTFMAGCADPSAGGGDGVKPGEALQENNQQETTSAEETTLSDENYTRQGTIGFKINEDGLIVGSPADYGIYMNLDDLQIKTEDFEENNDNYIDTVQEKFGHLNQLESAGYQDPNFHNAYICFYSVEGPAYTSSIALSKGGFTFGCSDHPDMDRINQVDFDANGLKIGTSTKEDVIAVFGEPTEIQLSYCSMHRDYENPDRPAEEQCANHHLYYEFEDTSYIRIGLVGNENTGEVPTMTSYNLMWGI